MDKKIERKSNNLGFYDDSMHLFHIAIEKELFKKFKAQCVLDKTSMKDKMTEMIESSLS